MQIDNDKSRRTRDARLSGSRIDLASLCTTNGGGSQQATRSATTNSTKVTVNGNSHSGSNHINGRRPVVDALGNTLPPLSPQSNTNNNNISPTSLTDKSSSGSFNVPMTPSGELFGIVSFGILQLPRRIEWGQSFMSPGDYFRFLMDDPSRWRWRREWVKVESAKPEWNAS